jgi:N-acetyl-gamma-glutamyl-phosphate reductase/N-acetyl-gamma-glutamyl-phosphate/LysW-gamma-L-alpha-aminoadipyl-6-phosphate reductase
MTRVGVVGASGLVGGELIRLVHQHPSLKLGYLGGHKTIGKRISELHPGLRIGVGIEVESVTVSRLAERCDVIVLATPPHVSAELAASFVDQGLPVVDISGAFRLRSQEVHRRWYPKVERSAGLAKQFVYGVPELIGEKLSSANLVSLPGCYATAVILAVAPLVMMMDLRLGRLLVDGKSGSSGGGLSLREADLHPYRDGTVVPYAPTGHRHAAEIDEFFAHHAPGRVDLVAMSAYGTGGVRGLLASCYAFVDDPVDARELSRAYLRFYRMHQFVRVRRHGETVIPVPNPKAVIGSNFCDVTAMYDADGGRIVALGALDNLIKGAAGQAIQAINLRFGHDQGAGLMMQPMVPV